MKAVNIKLIILTICLSLTFCQLYSASFIQKDIVVDVYNIDIRIQDDNLILVSEEIIIDKQNFQGFGLNPKSFKRELSFDFSKSIIPGAGYPLLDDYEFLSASINKEIIDIPKVNLYDNYKFKTQGRTFVWIFNKTKDKVYHLNLNYYLKGIITSNNNNDIFKYNIFSNHKNYLIKSSKITISYPKFSPDFQSFSTKTILNEDSNNKIINSINEEEYELILNLSNISPKNNISIELLFNKKSLIKDNPNWLTNFKKYQRNIFLYGFAVLFIVIIGLIIAIYKYLKINQNLKIHKNDRKIECDILNPENENHHLCKDLDADELAYLFNRINEFSDLPILSTLLKLFDLGYIKVIYHNNKYYLQRFIHQIKKDNSLSDNIETIEESIPNEIIQERYDFILNKIFSNSSEMHINNKPLPNIILFDNALIILKRIKRKYFKQLQKELTKDEYFDINFKKEKQNFTSFALILTALGALSIYFVIAYTNLINLYISFSIILSGIIMLSFSMKIKTFSLKAHQHIKNWFCFYTFLSNNLHNNKKEIFESKYLPYFVSFNLCKEFITELNKEIIINIPEWFFCENQDNENHPLNHYKTFINILLRRNK
ncbi:MAG: DUF2207 domain-containing protein [Candidatus Cloacimonetes bacterium]|nr:DUF2207 domain-containing protein [Candidatus Cloacimonadota bacterium]